MPSDQFLAELSELPVDDWLAACIKRYSLERLQGAKVALSLILKTLTPELEEEADEPLLRVGDFVVSVGAPPPMIINGVLPPNSFLLVTAKPKHGKTFFMLQMADDVATGGKLFGKWDIDKPGAVVYFAMEDGKHRFRERVMRRGMHERNPEVYIYTTRKDMSTAEGIQWMKDKIAPINPVLVIIDTARQAFNMQDWNSAGEVTSKVRPMMEATRDLPNGCSIVVVAHNNKNANAEGGDRISGSNALQSICDGYIIIDNKKRLATGDLVAEAECEGRIDMPDKFLWQMDTETLQIKVLDDEESEQVRHNQKEASFEKQYDRIERAILAKDGQATQAEIATHTGLTKQFISRIIQQMIRAERLKTDGERKLPKGGTPSTLYAIAKQRETVWGGVGGVNSIVKGDTEPKGDFSPSSDAVETFFGSGESEEI